MKKIVFIILGVLVLSSSFADPIISYKKLPEESKAFISTYFSKSNVYVIKKDFNEYEVNLNDGTELTFNNKGKWISVSSIDGITNTSFIPANIISSLLNAYPGIAIKEIERESTYYDLELINNRDIEIKEDGTILTDKID